MTARPRSIQPRGARRFALALRAGLGALLALAGGSTVRAAPTVTEAQVRAAFIFHFTQFVDWPPKAFAEPGAPFVIGVFGDKPIDEALTALIRGERFGTHPFEVRRLRRAAEASSCQIVYVSNEAENLFRPAWLRGYPVLLVGETEDFLRSGGMIEFFTDHNEERFRINLNAAHASSLDISAKLLRVAQVLPSP